MDLDSYATRYTGQTRLRRLLSISTGNIPSGSSTGNDDLARRQRALSLAEKQMRRDGNTVLYRGVFGGGEKEWASRATDNPKLFEGIPPFDEDWTEATENANRENRFVLEGRLSTAQSRLHKDAIRMAYLALAEHDARTAWTSYRTASVNGALFRAMDCCASRFQTAQIGLLIIESAINAGDFAIVKEYAERLGMTRSINNNKNNSGGGGGNNNADNYQESVLRDIDAKVQIAKGIERMVACDYSAAASVLVPLVMNGSGDNNSNNNNNNNNNTEHHMLHWPGVASPEDVALYAGLMCVVTRDRSKMLALADHPEALELVPAVKELLLFWSRANYAPCMRSLSESSSSNPLPTTTTTSSAKATLSQSLLPLGGAAADAYLTPTRWKKLVQTIRETCLVEYLRPYQRVKLERLRDLFFPSSPSGDDNDSLDTAIDGLADMMDRGLLPSTTRLDCREKILFQAEPPCDPGPNIRATEERVLDDAHAMLVRLACLEHDFIVTSDPTRRFKGDVKKGGSGSSRWHGRAESSGQGGRRGPGAMADSSGSDDDDQIYESYEDRAEQPPSGDSDTHMIDAESQHPSINAAMNPEDMY